MESLSFKDIIHNDIKQTFLNLEEFGETHEVNGTPMTIIFDDIEHVEPVLHVRCSGCLRPPPRPGQAGNS